GLLDFVEGHGGGDSCILGADLNLHRGTREPAFQALARAGFGSGVPARPSRWTHTYHGIPRLPIDHLLIRTAGGIVEEATVHRLDEHPRDAGPHVFGSDHHPLAAAVQLGRLPAAAGLHEYGRGRGAPAPGPPPVLA
nr:hypothetical protein [Gemmatimonadota bacterium]